MEPVRSSIPESLKNIVKNIVNLENSPFRSESEFIRLAIGDFASGFDDLVNTAVDDPDTWEDILYEIIRKGVFGISTRELKDKFPSMEKVVYYHLTNMKKRGLIEYMGVSSGIVRLRKKVALKSGFWRATEVGRRFEHVKSWRY